MVIPYNLYTEVWDYDEPVPPPVPPPFDETAYRKALCLLRDPSKRIGIYAGLGCVDAGPSLARVAELLQAPVATTVSGKGTIADCHPLAVGWGYGAQGTRTAERSFKNVDVVLAVGARIQRGVRRRIIPFLNMIISSKSMPIPAISAATRRPAWEFTPTRAFFSIAFSPIPR